MKGVQLFGILHNHPHDAGMIVRPRGRRYLIEVEDIARWAEDQIVRQGESRL